MAAPFLAVDLVKAYHQTPVEPADIPKAAPATRLNCATWVDALSLVLLGLRTVLRANLQFSEAEVL